LPPYNPSFDQSVARSLQFQHVLSPLKTCNLFYPGQVQEVYLTTTLDQEGIKKAVQRVLGRVP